MKTKNDNEIRDIVREKYKSVVLASGDTASCCSPKLATVSCCKPADFDLQALQLGYSETDLAAVPEGANLGLGCGNPQAIAKIKPGETVLDLGSGAGFDVFLAARQTGESGLVIGVDMTPEMLQKARENQAKLQLKQVDFRLGEIEQLPVADNQVDVIISNCVINLSPQKERVFAEAYRVLKPGGRLAVSDIVTLANLPDEIQADMELYSGCISGASHVDDLRQMLRQAGFIQIEIKEKNGSRELISQWDAKGNFRDLVISASIEAVKPMSVNPEELGDLKKLDNLTDAAELLKESKLPFEDLVKSGVQLWGWYSGGKLAALSGLEVYGTKAILRSFAIQKALRSNGLGALLLEKTEAISRQAGIDELFLLTTTASKFFARNGFESINRNDCPEDILKSSEFSSICPSTADCMHKILSTKPDSRCC